jgi:hypothetical protein
MIIPSARTSSTTVMKTKATAARRGETTGVGSVALMAALIIQSANDSKRIVAFEKHFHAANGAKAAKDEAPELRVFPSICLEVTRACPAITSSSLDLASSGADLPCSGSDHEISSPDLTSSSADHAI